MSGHLSWHPFNGRPVTSPARKRAAGHEPGVPRMTYISAANSLLTRFETYLAGVFHPVPQERVVAGAYSPSTPGFLHFSATPSSAASCSILRTRAGA